MPKRIGWLARLRKNHALEHATMHVLSQRHLNLPLAGQSDLRGFTLLGPVSTEEVASATVEALQRLQRGESALAVHPRCGTNLVVGAILASLFSFIVWSMKTRSRWERVPGLLFATTSALLLAQPLGLWIQQRFTTTSAMDGVRIGLVLRYGQGLLTGHRVTVEH